MPQPFLRIVLVEPNIPHNTGAIGRICVGLDASLHLIQPCGFSLTEKAVRRSGLDYWPHLDLHIHRNWQAFLATEQPEHLIFLSTKTTRSLYHAPFHEGAWLVFGNETRGLPPTFYEQYADHLYRIPMPGQHARSMNLANAAAVGIYEAYRQISVASSSSGNPTIDSGS